jgi:hypothetical protein
MELLTSSEEASARLLWTSQPRRPTRKRPGRRLQKLVAFPSHFAVVLWDGHYRRGAEQTADKMRCGAPYFTRLDVKALFTSALPIDIKTADYCWC